MTVVGIASAIVDAARSVKAALTPRKPLWRRLTLRHLDGRVYLDRWGIGHPKVGAVFLHRMQAPDPRLDLHDHPWSFVTVVLRGGYEEDRGTIRYPDTAHAPARTRLDRSEIRRPFRPRLMRLDECHTITRLLKPTSWSLVICGPVRRSWGFYNPMGWVHYMTYEALEQRQGRPVATWESNYRTPPPAGAPIWSCADPSVGADASLTAVDNGADDGEVAS